MMESVLAAAVTGILTLIGVLVGACVLDSSARAICVALCMAGCDKEGCDKEVASLSHMRDIRQLRARRALLDGYLTGA